MIQIKGAMQRKIKRMVSGFIIAKPSKDPYHKSDRTEYFKKYNKEYWQRPHVKEKNKLRMRGYYSDPEKGEVRKQKRDFSKIDRIIAERKLARKAQAN